VSDSLHFVRPLIAHAVLVSPRFRLLAQLVREHSFPISTLLVLTNRFIGLQGVRLGRA
jgi:hypothetical protein